MINNATISYPFDRDDLQENITYTAANKPEYIGRSRPGAATSAPEWQIQKCTYDGSNNLVSRRFADGINDYAKVWDNRAGYTY